MVKNTVVNSYHSDCNATKVKPTFYSNWLCDCQNFRILKMLLSVHNNSADSRLIWQGAVPCGPFRSLICTLRLFLMLYMRPAALSVRVSASVCACMSESRLKDF